MNRHRGDKMMEILAVNTLQLEAKIMNCYNKYLFNERLLGYCCFPFVQQNINLHGKPESLFKFNCFRVPNLE